MDKLESAVESDMNIGESESDAGKVPRATVMPEEVKKSKVFNDTTLQSEQTSQFSPRVTPMSSRPKSPPR
jgi:hypothetical protein